MAAAFPTLVEVFADLPDPRAERTRAHDLIDILVIAVCAVICGTEGWDDMALFGRAKQDWLRERLDITNGIPCADTFRRVLSRMDPQALQDCFIRWTQGLHEQTHGEVIALDGKTLRHSFDTAAGAAAIHMVTAWAAQSRLVLGQVKVDEKSNEIPAVPALLALLDIHGCIVTTDAMSCQRNTAAQIIDGGADYVLAVKDNQPALSAAIQSRFEHAQEHRFEGVAYDSVTKHDKGHGRLETRTCEHITLEEIDPYWWDLQRDWKDLRSIACVTNTRRIGDEVATEVRYFISSVADDVDKVANAVRQHWGIENRLHYVLDVTMDEDACRIRNDNGPAALAVLRHVALNLLRKEKTSGHSVRAKIKRAGWDNDFIGQILVS